MSRAVAVVVGRDILVLGGLDGAGRSVASVLRADPATGTVVAAGRLAQATHDAAAAVLGRTVYVFGGGAVASTDAIQAFPALPPAPGSQIDGRIAGRLPGRRSDLSAVTDGATTLLVGGWDGTRILPDILATTDGIRVRTSGSLHIPVRYAAVARVNGSVWVFGGQAAVGDIDTIQRLDTSTGRVTAAGRLPVAVAGASAFSLGGELFVVGGVVAGTATDRIWRFDPATGQVEVVGRLPYPVAYAAVAVVGGVALLLGGENSAFLDTVISIRLAAS